MGDYQNQSIFEVPSTCSLFKPSQRDILTTDFRNDSFRLNVILDTYAPPDMPPRRHREDIVFLPKDKIREEVLAYRLEDYFGGKSTAQKGHENNVSINVLPDNLQENVEI